MNDVPDDLEDNRRGDSDRFSDDEIIQRAKAKTSTAGTMLILAAVIMFLFSFLSIVLVFGMKDDLNVTILEYFKGMNQDPRFQDDIQKQIDARKNIDPAVKTVEKVTNILTTTLGMIGNFLVLYAGLSMKSLKNYPMCIVGCVFSFILNGCCCVGIPIGIWSLVVLVSPEVKEGFAAMKRRKFLAQ